ncbi:hypothetical protein CDL12_24560 [Handroanthus impetiginosus]|uniref:Uncharacterized protein n=1 Tax=Handroanthus impetiginosus TaxID=429701 RepID=A0A2G9GD57_9LAMI|nr:hypothetical protein CDL12_24560 [Handroanthus impetiginosus]
MAKRSKIIPILLALSFIFLHNGHATKATHTQFVKIKPKTHTAPYTKYFGSLPKGVPIPPSGPSRRHNGIVLQGGGGPP